MSVQHDQEMIKQNQANQTAIDSIHATVESSHQTVDSIQDTVESRQDNETFTQYKNYEVELEDLKLQVVKEIKDLLIKGINTFKGSFLKTPINSQTVIQQIDQTTANCAKNKPCTYTKN